MTSRWGLLTNHALVLINVIEHPRSTLRDIAAAVGITERATLSILRALEADAIIGRRKEGRRNVYTVDVEALLAYRAHAPYSIEQLASALFVLSGRNYFGCSRMGIGHLTDGGRVIQAAACEEAWARSQLRASDQSESRKRRDRCDSRSELALPVRSALRPRSELLEHCCPRVRTDRLTTCSRPARRYHHIGHETSSETSEQSPIQHVAPAGAVRDTEELDDHVQNRSRGQR